jgi:hypothetical protein
LPTSPPKGGIPQNALSYAPAIPFWGFYRSWPHASFNVKTTQGKKDSHMDKTKIDKEILTSLDLPDSIDKIIELTEMIKYDLMKAKKDSEKSGKFTISCLYRVRQLLVSFEKLGLQFRKLSIAYEKDLEQTKRKNKLN